MFNTNNGYSLADIAAATGNNRNNDGFGGDGWGWIWILLIFGIFGWGGNGFGGNGGANGAGLQGLATRSDINEGFALNGIETGIRSIQQGICDSTYALNNSLMSGFHGVDTALCNLGYQTQAGQNALSTQIANCCCETREAIAGVRYDMATQACDTRNTIQNVTRDIIDNQNAGTRQLLDFLTQDKIASLQAENQSLKFAASQAAQNTFLSAMSEAQTAELIRRINPMPVPAYTVPAPFGYGYGCNTGCGC